MLPFYKKCILQVYLYTIYWAIAAVRYATVKLLSLVWYLVQILPLSDAIFSRLLLIVYGCFATKPYQASLLQNKKPANFKLQKNTIICGQLTSPVDVLLYIKEFRPQKVLLPNNKFVSPATAFKSIMSLEDQFTCDELPQKFPQQRILVFPEQFPTNQSVVMKTYISSTYFLNRPVICAASVKNWAFIPKQHPFINFLTNIDDMGSIVYRQKLFVTVFKQSDDFAEDKVQKGIASCLGVECGKQGLKERTEYYNFWKQWDSQQKD